MRRGMGVPGGRAMARVLAEWTRSERCAVVYDSDRDGMDQERVRRAVMRRTGVVVVVVDADKNVFGVFARKPVEEPERWVKDKGWFVFSFSSNGRCETPQRWVKKSEGSAARRAYLVSGTPQGTWISVGQHPSGIRIGDVGWNHCRALSKLFVGLADTTLTGNTYPTPFVLHRLLILVRE